MQPIQTPSIRWQEGGQEHVARWRSEAGIAPHADIQIADDRTSADDAYRLLEAGTALLWRGDWVNARHLMQALTKRADRRFGAARGKAPKTPGEA
ncbi:MAG TPA: methyltransferase, partial [Azonexus sp.]|nr:methyltransferase [Azonexus sp.]